MPGHVPADLGEIGFAGAGFIDELAVEHHDQTIREFEQFVKVFADQQHRGAAIARGHDLGVDLRHRREVEAETRIGGDQHFDVAAELARQHRALNVAAGQCRDRRIRRPRLDFVKPDLLLGIVTKRRAIEPPAAACERRAIEFAERDVVGDAHAADAGVLEWFFWQ